jgi:hypothetical protein
MKTMEDNSTLDNFIKNFVPKDKRERVAFELKNEKKRAKFTNKLNHKWDTILDMRFVTKIPSSENDYEFAQRELKIKDGDLCYLISDHFDIDGTTGEFSDAFDKVYGKGFGSLVITALGDKFYLETELVQGKQNRFIGKLK